MRRITNEPMLMPHGLVQAEAAAEAREVEELQKLLTSGPSSRRAGPVNSPAGPSLAASSLTASAHRRTGSNG